MQEIKCSSFQNALDCAYATFMLADSFSLLPSIGIGIYDPEERHHRIAIHKTGDHISIVFACNGKKLLVHRETMTKDYKTTLNGKIMLIPDVLKTIISMYREKYGVISVERECAVKIADVVTVHHY